MIDFLTSLTHSELAAYWGAVLSTLLLAGSALNSFKKRFKLEASGTFTSDSNIGNEITIRNLNDYPVMISGWMVESRHKPLISKFKSILSSEFDDPDIIIAPHSSKVFNFNEAYYFNAFKYLREEQLIFIKLHIGGRRRPLRLKLT